MKKALIPVLFLMASSLFAATMKDLGSVKYYEIYTRDYSDLSVKTSDEGTIYLLTRGYTYQLTPQEKDVLASFIAKGLKFINIAVTNKTTIEFQKSLGEVPMSAINGLIDADFQTRGWEQSYFILTVTNSGRNLTLRMDEGQAGDLLASLNRSANQVSEVQRQIGLFSD